VLFTSKTPVLVVQNFLNSAFGLVGVYFITRYYPVAWGILSFGIGFVGVMSFITDMGYSTAYIKYLSSGEDEGTANSNYLIIKLILGIIFAIVTYGALLVWTAILHRGFEYSVEYWVVLGLVPYYFFVSMGSFPQSYHRTHMRAAKYAIPLIADAIIRNSLFIMIGLIAVFKPGFLSDTFAAIFVSLAYDFSYFVYFAISYYLGRPWKYSKISLAVIKKYSRTAIPLSLAAIIGTVNGNIDKVIIQFFWGDFATGGFYLAQKIALILSNLGTAITIFFLPVLSRLHAKEDTKNLNVQTNEFERLVVIFILPFVVLTLFLSYNVMRIFSAIYTPYSEILAVLSINAIFVVLMVPSSSALIAKGHTRTVGLLTVMTLTMNIILNLILIPQSIFGVTYLSLGPLGGGVSSLVASFFLYVSLRISLYRTSGIEFSARTFYPAVPAAVEALFIYVFTMYINPQRIFILLPLAVASVLLFIAMLLLTKQMQWKDFSAFITNLLNPFHTTNSLKSERKQ
jgi:O-antigen/teichoic acid export membrane protein